MTAKTRQRLLDELGYSGRDNSRMSLMFRNAIADGMGLGVTDAECMDFLLEAGSATAGELAAKAGLTSGAMTSAIDRLERAGFVRREPDTKDRRRVIVKPVLENLDKANELYGRFVAAVGAVLEGFSEEELAVVIRYNQALTEVYRRQIELLRSERRSDRA